MSSRMMFMPDIVEFPWTVRAAACDIKGYAEVQIQV
jgi:hypothetical protein